MTRCAGVFQRGQSRQQGIDGGASEAILHGQPPGTFFGRQPFEGVRGDPQKLAHLRDPFARGHSSVMRQGRGAQHAGILSRPAAGTTPDPEVGRDAAL